MNLRKDLCKTDKEEIKFEEDISQDVKDYIGYINSECCIEYKKLDIFTAAMYNFKYCPFCGTKIKSKAV